MKTLKEYAQIVENRLQTILPELEENSCKIAEMPELLVRSMRYSLLAGGKRLRPSMMLAAMDMLGGDGAAYLDFACAVEMIHSYSLIHDDLPGMDDDTMRRGRPTNHVVFGVGQAILAGDGLLNYAFETMLKTAIAHPENAQNALCAISEIAAGAGVGGMIGGQVMDLYCERNRISGKEALNYIQYGKTACMFIHPLRAAAYLSGAGAEQIDAIGAYGKAFGLLFQATDDLLDVVGDSAEMGKTLGKDAQQGKLTMISEYGIEGTRREIEKQQRVAHEALAQFGNKADFFRELIDSMVNRSK